MSEAAARTGPVAGNIGLTAHLGPDELAARRVWVSHLRGEAGQPGLSLNPDQWRCLADEALRHGLGALAFRLLEDGPLARSIPATVNERLRSQYVSSAFQNAVLLRRTAEFAAALARVGIPVILLKGIHLCRFVYPEPALRTMADVDLLVPRERLADAEQVFLDLGFGPVPRPDIEQFCTWSNHLAKLYRPGAPVVELHWAIERPTSPFRIDLDGLWKRARPAKLEGVPVCVLAPEDLLLHLALHDSYHHRFDWSALKGLVDIDQVVARHGAELDWAALGRRANAWGASGFVYTTLRLAHEILATPLPQAAFGALEHDDRDEAVVEIARQHVLSRELELPKPYLELADKPGLRERWKLFRHAVFLPRESLERLYGPRRGAAALYPSQLRRVVDLLGRRGRLLLQSLLRTRTMESALEREANRDRIEHWAKRGSEGQQTAKSGQE